MRGQPKISPIYRLGQPAVDLDPLATYSRIDKLRCRAFRENGIVAVTLRELPEPLRSEMQKWAEDNYGR